VRARITSTKGRFKAEASLKADLGLLRGESVSSAQEWYNVISTAEDAADMTAKMAIKTQFCECLSILSGRTRNFFDKISKSPWSVSPRSLDALLERCGFDISAPERRYQLN